MERKINNITGPNARILYELGFSEGSNLTIVREFKHAAQVRTRGCTYLISNDVLSGVECD